VLRDLPQANDPNLLVGYSKAADAAIYKVRDDLALIQTVDFFTPIVDDPYVYGEIAAANSLSDVYAMGGRPLTALNVVSIPSKKVPAEIVGRILRGGTDKAAEAGCLVVGGHTVDGAELMYGMSVTGVIHPRDIVTNEAARPGDALILTKALGTGIVTTAAKLGKLPSRDGDAVLSAAIASMALLNRKACEAMVEAGARAATDITGFGLLGHAYEFARASGVTFRLRAQAIPVLPGALDLAGRGVLTGADGRNRQFTSGHVRVGRAVGAALERVLHDAQTSGGLLIAAAPDAARAIVARLEGSAHAPVRMVGEVEAASDVSVVVD
jgi:selenide,water dikinase